MNKSPENTTYERGYFYKFRPLSTVSNSIENEVKMTCDAAYRNHPVIILSSDTSERVMIVTITSHPPKGSEICDLFYTIGHDHSTSQVRLYPMF